MSLYRSPRRQPPMLALSSGPTIFVSSGCAARLVVARTPSRRQASVHSSFARASGSALCGSRAGPAAAIGMSQRGSGHRVSGRPALNAWGRFAPTAIERAVATPSAIGGHRGRLECRGELVQECCRPAVARERPRDARGFLPVIALHAIWSRDSRLCVWGEDSALPPRAPTRRGTATGEASSARASVRVRDRGAWRGAASSVPEARARRARRARPVSAAALVQGRSAALAAPAAGRSR